MAEIATERADVTVVTSEIRNEDPAAIIEEIVRAQLGPSWW